MTELGRAQVDFILHMQGRAHVKFSWYEQGRAHTVVSAPLVQGTRRVHSVPAAQDTGTDAVMLFH